MIYFNDLASEVFLGLRECNEDPCTDSKDV